MKCLIGLNESNENYVITLTNNLIREHVPFKVVLEKEYVYDEEDTNLFYFGSDYWLELMNYHEYHTFWRDKSKKMIMSVFGEKYINHEGYEVFLVDLLDYVNSLKFDEYHIAPSYGSWCKGGVKNASSTRSFISKYLQTGEEYDPSSVIVSRKKYITNEWVFFVVGGKLITGCRIYCGGCLALQNIDSSMSLKFYSQVKALADLWKERAFTITIGEANKEMFVVDVNHINISPFYECDARNVVKALKEEFSK